jgi:hypothetical protein
MLYALCSTLFALGSTLLKNGPVTDSYKSLDL